MSNEVLAYKKGYRITENGFLYRLDGKKITVSTKKNNPFKVFHISVKKNGRNSSATVYVHRYLAFNFKLSDFNRYRFIGLKDNNPENISINNLDFGKGSELITPWHSGKCLEQVAVSLGYSVSKSGNLLYCGFEVSKKSFSGSNYQMFGINIRTGRSRNVFVHRLQAYLKYGAALYNEGMLVRHLNDVKSDNSYDNIAIGSHLDNFNDMSSLAWNSKYEKARDTHSRYSLEDRQKVRDLFDTGWTYKQLANKFNYSLSTIRRINVLER